MLIDKGFVEEYPMYGYAGNFVSYQSITFFLRHTTENFQMQKRLLFIFNDAKNDGENTKTDNRNILKLLNNGLSDGNLIKRLFENQISQNIPFRAEDVGLLTNQII